MRKGPVIFITSFFAILAAFFLMAFILPGEAFSEHENRYLEPMPNLSLESLLNGQFQEDLSEYLSDHIPGRTLWIQWNTSIKKLLGYKEINDVYIGKDGYYFQKFTQDSYSDARASAIFALLEKFTQKQTVPVNLMIVPTPASILTEKLPENAPAYDFESVYKKLLSAVPSANGIDLYENFCTAANDRQLYYKTDHHWTAMGAYVAYRSYCAALGRTPKAIEDFALAQCSDAFYGTIYSKTLDPDAMPDAIYAAGQLPKLKVIYDDQEISDTIYAPEYLDKKDKYAYFFGGNWGKVEIRTPADNGKNLLIIKDSFANSFVPYLLGDYENIVMLDLRYFNGDIDSVIRAQGTTEILITYEMTNLLTDTGIVQLGR